MLLLGTGCSALCQIGSSRKSRSFYPRLHHPRALLSESAKGASSKELEEFIRDNRVSLSNLEDAYLIARYTTKTYLKEDAEDMVRLAETAISTVKRAFGVDR